MTKIDMWLGVFLLDLCMYIIHYLQSIERLRWGGGGEVPCRFRVGLFLAIYMYVASAAGGHTHPH